MVSLLLLKQLAKVEKHPRTRIKFIGLSHIQNGKSYEQVAQYLLQSLSAVKKKSKGPCYFCHLFGLG
jgi:hypothetical protein